MHDALGGSLPTCAHQSHLHVCDAGLQITLLVVQALRGSTHLDTHFPSQVMQAYCAVTLRSGSLLSFGLVPAKRGPAQQPVVMLWHWTTGVCARVCVCAVHDQQAAPVRF